MFAASQDGDTLESIAGQIGVTVGTVRNYIQHLSHGAQAEQTGNAAAYANESSYRPDQRRELSAKAIASLIRAKSTLAVVWQDSDGKQYFPQFAALRRGWHFVTFGDSLGVPLARMTAETRGFKLHKPDGETVIKVRRWEETAESLILFESATTEDSDTVA